MGGALSAIAARALCATHAEQGQPASPGIEHRRLAAVGYSAPVESRGFVPGRSGATIGAIRCSSQSASRSRRLGVPVGSASRRTSQRPHLRRGDQHADAEAHPAAASAASTTRRPPDRSTGTSSASAGGAMLPTFRRQRSVGQLGGNSRDDRVIARPARNPRSRRRAPGPASTSHRCRPTPRNRQRARQQHRQSAPRSLRRWLPEVDQIPSAVAIGAARCRSNWFPLAEKVREAVGQARPLRPPP